MSLHSNKLSYRPEIDGLRAIAVVSVILYHAKFSILGTDLVKGGFIGVDIFFVLSGYLITRIILSELYNTGTFSITNFYEKRARRILPMLLLILLFFIPFAWMKLLPSGLIEYGQSGLSSIFFGSNFFFYFSTTDYGADSSLLKPLLHTWSLGVEEQFYLVFPIIAIFAFKYLNKYFLVVLLFLSLISLVFSQVMDFKNSDLNFFLPFSRFWELAAGSILAYLELNNKRKKTSQNPIIQTLPVLGVIMLLYSITFFDSRTPHPSFITIIPILGVVLVIRYGTATDLIGKVLASKPFVWIGLISYSAYLWHFPIFAFARHHSLTHDSFDKLGWIAITAILSYITYRYVEQPFRNRKQLPSKQFWTGISLALLFTITLLCAVSLGKITNKSALLNEASIVSSLLDNGQFREEHRKFEMDYDYSVKMNDKKTILIVGNSHGEDLLKTLSHSYLDQTYNLTLASPQKRKKDINYQVQCFYHFLKYNSKSCNSINFVPNIIDQYETADIVLLATNWRRKDLENIDDLLRILTQDQKHVIIVSETPQSKVFGERKLNRFDKFLFEEKRLPNESELHELERLFYKDYTMNQFSLNSTLKGIVENFSSDKIQYVSLDDFMCDNNQKRCSLFYRNSQTKVLWDYGHTTTGGAKELSKRIDEIKWLSEELSD